jgi:hypothetical protein
LEKSPENMASVTARRKHAGIDRNHSELAHANKVIINLKNIIGPNNA